MGEARKQRAIERERSAGKRVPARSNLARFQAFGFVGEVGLGGYQLRRFVVSLGGGFPVPPLSIGGGAIAGEMSETT